MMSVRKCSYQAIQHCKSEINSYLKNKGESDFSKYKVSFKDDSLFFDKWEYSNIQKPVNINLIPKTVNYYDLYARKIVLTISENEEIKPIFLNVDGERVTSNYIDKQNRYVQKILEASEYVNGQWKPIENENFYLGHGVIVINNHKERRFKGEIHIVILYRFEESEARKQSVSKTTTTSSMYYTLPKNY
jgi:hypothetical protein